MRLAFRLAITFGLLAAASTAGVGLALRQGLVAKETKRFQHDVDSVCGHVLDEVRRQGEADQRLIAGACQSGELVDRVAIAIARGELDERRTAFSPIVREERRAFDLDELVLGVQGGDIVGASPTTLLGLPSREVDALLSSKTSKPVVRGTPTPAIVTRCQKPATSDGRIVGLVGARHLDPLLDRLARTLDVVVHPSWPAPPKRASEGDDTPSENVRTIPRGVELARATCKLPTESSALTFEILKSTRELDATLHDVDRTVGLYAAVSGFVAFVLSILLARSLSRPLADLAKEAGKVAAGEAHPLRVRGSGEVAELVGAFDKMIQDLAVTRRRLAAASRVAAWREVARRVAHEVKNPLAPIRAAVETLRRLRAREDPRFDEYFDEATRTVLDEVHRISNIVTEFTRFARLPEPRPTDIDVEDLVNHVLQVHKAAAGDVRLSHIGEHRAPVLRADRDQIIQVLTNLVQNALDAVKEQPSGAVTLTTDNDGHYVSFSVADNGKGIAAEIAMRLFEPYATTKASGTGLGLAIAQRIAIEHNGELSYVGPSANGRGAVFRLLLPIEGPPPPSADAPPSDG